MTISKKAKEFKSNEIGLKLQIEEVFKSSVDKFTLLIGLSNLRDQIKGLQVDAPVYSYSEYYDNVEHFLIALHDKSVSIAICYNSNVGFDEFNVTLFYEDLDKTEDELKSDVIKLQNRLKAKNKVFKEGFEKTKMKHLQHLADELGYKLVLKHSS